jgi:hypothetical protein
MTGDAPRSSTFGERDVLKLMYAALIRAWRGLTEFEPEVSYPRALLR